MRVETIRAAGRGTWIAGLVGTQTERFRNVTLTDRDIESLTILDSVSTFNGDGQLLRLGLQAYALGMGTVTLGAFDDAGVRSVLGLPKNQTPLYLMPVGKTEARGL